MQGEGDDSSDADRACGLRGWLHDRYSEVQIGLATCGFRSLALDAPSLGLAALAGPSG